MLGALDLGLLYAVMALGVFITFRVLNFPDLTVDGSFTTGAAVAAMLITAGIHPLVAMGASMLAGTAAGLITGLLHAKGGINPLLAGILTQIALYSINLRIMDGRAQATLLRKETLLSPLRDNRLFASWTSAAIFLAAAVVVCLLLWVFLRTDLGLALQATGDNEGMIRSLGANTDNLKILGLMVSNALVALAGSLIAQYQGTADIGMGIGLIVAGLASVIIGQALVRERTILFSLGAVVLGSVLYREAIQLALMVGLNPNDMKLVSAVLVVIALLLPKWSPVRAIQQRIINRDIERELAGTKEK